MAGLFILLSTYEAFAHPGHGDKNVDGNSVWHFVSEPIHIISFGIFVLVFLLVRMVYLKSKRVK